MTDTSQHLFSPYRFFSSEKNQRKLAFELYQQVEKLPIVSPHGHVDPSLFSDPNATFGSPVDLLIIPDHYVTGMLYSQGIPLESMAIEFLDICPLENANTPTVSQPVMPLPVYFITVALELCASSLYAT